ncbi:MAG: Holliday junction resolvase RuvX [Candidatus Neomarinimicrobiota bacterium]
MLDFFRKLNSEKNIESIVIGLPLGMNGKDTLQTKNVRIFSKSIGLLGLPIFFQDERLTSISAKKFLIKQNIKTGHNKDKIDEIAATIFLQQFLDMNN